MEEKRLRTEDDLTGDDLKQYEADIDAMDLILLLIPNDIYNSVDACENAKDMWERVKRLIQCTDLSEKESHSRFMNEFDKFTFEVGESLTSVYERFSRLQYEGLVNASRAKRATKTHDPLALVANTYASSLSSLSPPAYYVLHPPLVIGYDDDYPGEAICDD
ncbi:hypothetical protein Tco_0809267 [Tanacetum coccineum]